MPLIYEHILRHLHINTPAICAPARQPFSYAGLINQIHHHNRCLNAAGIHRESVVALVLPNGPEAAASFLSIACTCIAAPLNHGFRQEEFEYYYADLNAEAVVLPVGVDSAARQAARSLNIRILEIYSNPAHPSGSFSFTGLVEADTDTLRQARETDIALALHTSGTTARPKIVPLTQANLTSSADCIQQSLALTSNDCCLNIMPLFHIHGLVGCLLSTLFAGASIVCTEGFIAPRFFDWFASTHPTWYSAVPSMHQAVLDRSQFNLATIQTNPLRFIRSCSAPLQPALKQKLETVFHSPVIEAYGMTEAAHQISSNPLPPAVRKPGSVGLPTGTRLTILSTSSDEPLPVGQPGEIAISGRGITPGYLRLNAPDTSFTDSGWFRTGDLGYQDPDGYLYLTARIKEIINRGGEKISPAEVDCVLLDHPGVQQALTFSMPDARLGEEIAAAVVRRDADLSEHDLRTYAAIHLSDHKVPRKIVFVDEIPKGPTGKLNRIGLAKALGLDGVQSSEISQLLNVNRPSADNHEDISDLENLITEFWKTMLEMDDISKRQNFFEAGGDSISAARIAARIVQAFDVPFSIVDFLEASTIEKQAECVEKLVLKQIEAMTDSEAALALRNLQHE